MKCDGLPVNGNRCKLSRLAPPFSNLLLFRCLLPWEAFRLLVAFGTLSFTKKVSRGYC